MLLDYSFWASIVTPALAMRTMSRQFDAIADGEPTGAFPTEAAARSTRPRAR